MVMFRTKTIAPMRLNGNKYDVIVITKETYRARSHP